jgi:hypothetical protein
VPEKKKRKTTNFRVTDICVQRQEVFFPRQVPPSNFCEATPFISVSSLVKWSSFLGHRIIGRRMRRNNVSVSLSGPWLRENYFFPFFSDWDFCLPFTIPHAPASWARDQSPHISHLD